MNQLIIRSMSNADYFSSKKDAYLATDPVYQELSENWTGSALHTWVRDQLSGMKIEYGYLYPAR